jgi:hypothetical protein
MSINSQIAVLASTFTAIAIFGIIVIVQEKEISKLKKERSQLIRFDNRNAPADSVTHYKTKFNHEAAKVKILDVTLRSAQQLQALAWVKEFEGLHKRINNLESTIRATVKVDRTFSPIVLRDTIIKTINDSSIHAQSFLYLDSMTSLAGTIEGNVIKPKIEMIVPLRGVAYWQRKKFLGLVRMWPAKKEWSSEIISTNPFARITQLEVIKIEKK